MYIIKRKVLAKLKRGLRKQEKEGVECNSSWGILGKAPFMYLLCGRKKSEDNIITNVVPLIEPIKNDKKTYKYIVCTSVSDIPNDKISKETIKFMKKGLKVLGIARVAYVTNYSPYAYYNFDDTLVLLTLTKKKLILQKILKNRQDFYDDWYYDKRRFYKTGIDIPEKYLYQFKIEDKHGTKA